MPAPNSRVPLEAMLARVAERADQLHGDLHDLGCDLSHQASHWLKKAAKLTEYMAIEAPNQPALETKGIATRNLDELAGDLRHFQEAGHADGPMTLLGRMLELLLSVMESAWEPIVCRDCTGPDMVAGFARLEELLAGSMPTARADIAFRHAHIALAILAKAWRALDKRLGDLPAGGTHHGHGHDHDHGHGHDHDHGHGHGH